MKRHNDSFTTPLKRQGDDAISVVSRDFSERKYRNIRAHKKDVDMDKQHFLRKVSKYDIDRGCVDFGYLKKEKQREITENN